MLVHTQVAFPPPRTTLGVYADDMALVSECLRRIVAGLERALLLQTKAAVLSAAPHKTVFVWLSLHSGLLSCANVRTVGVYLSVAILPAAPRHLWAAAPANHTQRATAISRGGASARVRVDEFVVYGASVLPDLLQHVALDSEVKRFWRWVLQEVIACESMSPAGFRHGPPALGYGPMPQLSELRVCSPAFWAVRQGPDHLPGRPDDGGDLRLRPARALRTGWSCGTGVR